MGETTCFMQPFSYASGGLPCDHHPIEGNPMHHALTQSISFGRFASESPSWDRWSAFPGNRYVEEAEKFSRPGSVAQKKAFFEAHYKNMAARKAAAAAALLEQANAAAKSDCEGRVAEDVSCNEFMCADVADVNDRSIEVESRDNCRNDQVQGTFTSDESKSLVEIPKSELEKIEKSKTSSTSPEDRAADPVNREVGVQEEPLLQFPVSDHLDEAGDVESSEYKTSSTSPEDRAADPVNREVGVQEEPLLQFPVSDHLDEAGDVESSEYKTSSTSPEDRPADPVNREVGVKEEPLLQFLVSDHLDEAGDVESSESSDMEKPLLKDFICEEVSKVADQNEPAVVCSKILRNQKSSFGVTSSPAVASKTPRPYWKGYIATTPIGWDSIVDRSDMKRLTPRRLPLGYLTPVREINKATSWRMGNSKPSSGLTKDCRTPAKTPTVAPSHATSKYTLTTPTLVNERTTPAGDGKQTGPKRRSLAKECSKFLSACKNKLQSPSLSTPFRLRTEERAARRKEKLEEKFNAERERIQLQHIHKEKEEVEVKKFRQTLCFKARPLPKFYRENTTAAAKTPTKKAGTNCSEPIKRSRKPWSSSTTTLPNRISPNLQGRKLVLGMSLHDLAPENRSPNIHQ